jgi:hypothetical protein
MRYLITILAIALTAACTTTGESLDRQEEMAVYERHAGAPQAWVRYRTLQNWWPVGLSSIVVEDSRDRHYLLDLSGPCEFALSGSATLRFINDRRNVISEFDEIRVGRGNTCHIQSIHELDMAAVREELDAKKTAMREASGEITTETADQSSGGT